MDQRAPVADAGSQLRNAFAASVDVPRLVDANPAMRPFALLVFIRGNGQMSGYGYKQTSSHPKSMSALPPTPDILVAVTDFRF